MRTSYSSNDKTSRLLLALVAIVGLLLLVISVPIHEEGWTVYIKVFFRELGIVVLAVFTISLLYEVWLAKKYQEQFLSMLSERIEEGESNASVCAALSISHIFRSRYEFEREHPFRELLGSVVVGGAFRVIGRSLFLIMTQVEELKGALSRGVKIELCLLDPSIDSEQLRISPDVEPNDINSTLATFTTKILPWLCSAKPSGNVEIRCHRIHLLDSAVFVEREYPLCIWELSFGRALDSKRLFLADPSKGLGADLQSRYESVWRQSKPVFHYNNEGVVLNKLKPNINEEYS